MVNKLRIKFIAYSLTLFGFVLIAFFMISFYLTKLRIEADSLETLHLLSNNNGKMSALYSKKNHITPPNFTTFVDSDGIIIQSKIISYPEEFVGSDISLIQELINYVLKNRNTTGVVNIKGTYGLRFLVADYEDGKKITFISRSIEASDIEKSQHSAIQNTLALTILLLGTSIILSFWTYIPVKKAFAQQQQFIADASHELRTPLTAIQSNIDVLLSSNDTTKEQTKWLTYVKNEIIRMSTLTNDLLLLSKFEHQNRDRFIEKIDFSSLISETCLSIESLAFENHKVLQEKITPQLYTLGEKNHLRQLALILIDNAIKYSPLHSTININVEKSNSRIIFTIENPSIDNVDSEKIFLRFYRDDKSRNRNLGGNGLGLSIAQSIVEAHNGKITAKSSHNQFTITVNLPLARGG